MLHLNFTPKQTCKGTAFFWHTQIKVNFFLKFYTIHQFILHIQQSAPKDALFSFQNSAFWRLITDGRRLNFAGLLVVSCWSKRDKHGIITGSSREHVPTKSRENPDQVLTSSHFFTYAKFCIFYVLLIKIYELQSFLRQNKYGILRLNETLKLILDKKLSIFVDPALIPAHIYCVCRKKRVPLRSFYENGLF